jgi:primase-polymerase (primpol)-like protein
MECTDRSINQSTRNNYQIPAIAPVRAERIPTELKDDHWVNWRYEWRQNRKGEWKLTKIPRTHYNKAASHSDPDTWADFDKVLIHAEESDGKRGIGRVFSAFDSYCGLDFDNCLNENGVIKEWARPWIIELQERGAYIEVSPSGAGLKAIVKATLPGKGRRTKIEDGEIEVYDRLRFFTFTGEVYDA